MRSLSPLALLVSVACASTSSPASPHDGHGAHHAHGPHHAHHAHGTAQHDFSNAREWSLRFDDPARDAWQKPDEVVKLLAMAPGMTVVDLGAGTGYFGERLATAAGPSGRLLALDTEPNMVAFMHDRFAQRSLANAEARVCPTDATGLAPGSVDRVLIVDTWHHLADRPAYAKHLAEVLRPGGVVMIVDFTLETEKGPPKGHRVDAEAALRELAAGGLEATLLEETLPDQYVAAGRKTR
jgi:cyclopropane fatty-acyl-phospholipid synthase-like methyltransferase